VREEGGGGVIPGARPEIFLQPLKNIMVEQISSACGEPMLE